MENKSVQTVITLQIKDIELNTVMDTGFFGAYSVSPAIHSHPCYEFIAAINGKLFIESLSGEPIVIPPGTVCVIPPGFYHCTTAKGETPEKLAIRFNYRRVGADGGVYDLFDSALGRISSPVRLENGGVTVEIIERLRRELCSDKLCGEAMVESLFVQLYIETLRLICRSNDLHGLHERTTETADSVHSRYYNIEMWFGNHFSENVTEDDLARELSLSKRQLSRNLREIYGMSFREKLCDVRVHNAAKLLMQTDSPVEKIAALVGYESPSGLYRAFERQLGKKLSEYRTKTTDMKR